jgi:hypothetical protein
LSAGPINVQSSFNFAGNLTVTLIDLSPSPGSINTINWNANTTGNPPNLAEIGPFATGDFAGVLLSGMLLNIANLDSAIEPSLNPDGTFPAQPFISFNPAGLFPDLMINQIFHGFAIGCPLTTPAVGQVCTPALPPGSNGVSPFNFVNNPGIGGSITSTATFSFSGITAGRNQWEAVFTSQFLIPYQFVLNELIGLGQVQNTFSASVLVSGPVPEPRPSALIGLGLVLVVLSAGLRRRALSRRH